MDVLIQDLYYQEMFTELSLMRDKMSHEYWKILLLRDGFLYDWNDIAFYFDTTPHHALNIYRDASNTLNMLKK